MRVMYVSATDRLGGAEISLLTLLQALDRDAVEPLLVCPGEDGASDTLSSRAVKAGVEVVRLPLMRFRRTFALLELFRAWRHCRKTRSDASGLARRYSIDLIHANSPTAALQVGGAPIVCHLRDLRLPYPAANYIAGNVAMLIATSSAVADFARSRGCQRVRKIANAVDTGRFRPGASAHAGGEPYLLMVGNLVPWKEHELFIEVLAETRRTRPWVRGVIAGGDLFGDHPEHVDRLKALAIDLGLEHALTWREQVSFEDMPELIAGASVLVHPAENEPFGRSVLEAMATATPVVAASSAGPRELLASGGGTLVEPGDIEKMADAVGSFLDDPALSRTAGEVGRTEVMKKYDSKTHAEAMTALYQSLV